MITSIYSYIGVCGLRSPKAKHCTYSTTKLPPYHRPILIMATCIYLHFIGPNFGSLVRCVAHHISAHVCMWVGVLGGTRIHAGLAVVWFGSQAFNFASGYNENIGAWNTASVSNMVNVSAISAGARNAADSLCRSLFDAARPLCVVAPPMRL